MVFFLFILFVIILPGFLLSFYHVFTKREKSRIEKHLMMLFAVITNAIIGIVAGIYIVRECPVWLLVFPVLNIINCVFILIMIDARILNETCIIERKTTPARAVLGLITTIVIFVLCNYVLNLNWAVTFSVCIIYATNFEKALQNVLFRKPETTNAESL
jgi:ABC-type proline/glycine betaine transport system permease subunit